MAEILFDGETTMAKVRLALMRLGLSDQQITEAIDNMLSAGILFREKK